jgi:AcrR family transcriptional regulator
MARQGLLGVTMSQVAQEAGIGRATLYKYFPDVETIIGAWHQRQIAGHLEELSSLGKGPGEPRARIEAVLQAYAHIQRQRHDHSIEVASQLHRGHDIAQAETRLTDFLEALLVEGIQTGHVRDDVPPRELATYCMHALSAAAGLPSDAAADRLVAVTLRGLQPHLEPGTNLTAEA